MAIAVPTEAASRLAMIGRAAVCSIETVRRRLELPKIIRKLSSVGRSGSQCRSVPAAVHSSTGLKAIEAIQAMGMSAMIRQEDQRVAQHPEPRGWPRHVV